MPCENYIWQFISLYSYSNVRKIKDGKHHGLYEKLKEDIESVQEITDKARLKKYPTSSSAETAIAIAQEKTKMKFDDSMISSNIINNATKQKSRRERETLAKESISNAISKMGDAILEIANQKSSKINESSLCELKNFIRKILSGETKKNLQTALLLDSQEWLMNMFFSKIPSSQSRE